MDNLLDISKLDSEGFEACLGNFDISDLLKNIFFEFHEIARSRGIHFHTSLCHYTVCSDALLVERVIRNLLSNAFKYTRNKVLLGCKRENDRIRVLVMDNGEGITAEEKNAFSMNSIKAATSTTTVAAVPVWACLSSAGYQISSALIYRLTATRAEAAVSVFFFPLKKVLKKPRFGAFFFIQDHFAEHEQRY